jgi:hypothetical protein
MSLDATEDKVVDMVSQVVGKQMGADPKAIAALAKPMVAQMQRWKITVRDEKTGEVSSTESRSNRSREEVEAFMRNHLIKNRYPNPFTVTATPLR